MGSIIEMRAVTKLYKNGRGVKNITLNVEDGDILGLLGPNGSGKTTIMKLILGLIRQDKGRIKIFNRDLEHNFEAIMEKTGALIEAPAIYHNMTARQNLKLTARMRKLPESSIDEALQLMRLTPYQNEKAGKFSLGMKQRLGLAAAFLSKPTLMILDEPVNGLDIEGVVEVRELIKAMREKYGTTFVISSHIASEIEKICNKVAVVYESELIAFDTVANATRLNPSLEEYFLDVIKQKRGVI